MALDQLMRCPSCEMEVPCSFAESWKEFSLFRCKACGLVFSEPSSARSEYYESHPEYARLERDVPLAWYHRAFLKKRLKLGGRLLDVGCATGNFLRACADSYDVEGIDFNRNLVEFGKRRYGLRLFAKSPAGHSVDNKAAFDVITCFETLEHQGNPAVFLRRLISMLKEDGVLVFSVPNRPLSSRLLPKEMDSPPHHFLRWDARSLMTFLKRNGLEAVMHRHHFGNWVFTFERIVALALPRVRSSYRLADVREGGFKRKLFRAFRALLAVPALLTYPVFLLFPTGGIQLFVVARRRRV